MKLNKHPFLKLAGIFFLVLGLIYAGVIVAGNMAVRREKAALETVPGLASERKIQVGSDPEKGLWIHGTASKIDPSKSPTDPREIANNTLLRYENNSSPILRSEIVRHLSQLIGINITVGKTINIYGEPNVPESIVHYFKDEVLNAAKDEDALYAVYESAIIKHPQGWLPLSQAYDILNNKEQPENAEQFLKKIASFTKSELVWTKNGAEFQPRVKDVRPFFPKDHN
jgi:hypothetical protein